MTEPNWNEPEALAAELAAFYGDGEGTPTRAQWREVIAAEAGGPICVVNFVKLRREARYPADADHGPATGPQALSSACAATMAVANRAKELIAAGEDVVGDLAETRDGVVVDVSRTEDLLALEDVEPEGDLSADAQSFDPPVEAGSLDAILCLDVLEHLPDPWAVVKRLGPLLKPGGGPAGVRPR